MSGLPPACVPEEHRACSVCGDEGLLGEVLEAPNGEAMGRVRLERESAAGGGLEQVVAFDLLEDVGVGDRVVVHMGFAIARVREEA